MITSRISEWARSHPTKTAAIFNNYQLSYADFSGLIEASHQFLCQQKLPIGRTAIVFSKNTLNAWILITALRAAGLNTIAIQSPAQVAELKIKNAVCVVVLHSEPLGYELSSQAFAGLRLVRVAITKPAGGRATDQQSEAPFGGHIIYSSGTTGTYKKIMVDGAVEDQRNEARARGYSFDSQTVYHTLDFGMWTTVGFKNPSAVWHAGGCVVFDQTQDKFKQFFRHNITAALMVPAQLQELVQLTDSSGPPRAGFELIVTAGFLPLALAEAAVQQLTKNVSLSYGSSELGSPLMRSHFRTNDDLHWFTPIEDRIIQIVDEDGHECTTDQEGELRIRPLDIDCTSYLDDEDTSSQVFRDGFFHPGDMAIRRADGRIRILGRTADVLNVRGNKIAAAPLEDALQHTLHVDEVCIFSGLDDNGKEELVIAIQSDHELSPAQLEAAARKAPAFQNVRFSVWKEFPRTETGMRKTRRAVLRKLVFAGKNQTN